ncbi:MAG TPA: ABC transporter ATP-binding protein [Chryseosolibacter sp.]
MSEIAISVSHLSKKFFIGNHQSGDLRESFRRKINQVFKNEKGKKEPFWALRDLNCEIKAGTITGIIGRNGAGKSTLLKILSRITYPTSGKFEIEGRVSSLLEVGTGFHSELTGRENVFLNGTILGMRRTEIKEKFDAIVNFSGIENFIDTPVKHYSSGMVVRLAFSVAAHLEPEILMIDEVLAVGDAEFQKKCLGKMDEVTKQEGRTILFVSHNMAAVEHLCTGGILLEKGQIRAHGDIGDVVEKYLASETDAPNDKTKEISFGNGVIGRNFTLSHSSIAIHGDLSYSITIESPAVNQFTDLALLVYNHLNERIGVVDLRHQDLLRRSALSRTFTVSGKIRGLPLIPGTYLFGLYVVSFLCRGDFLNLKRLEIIKPKTEFVPYAEKHRGYVEFDNTFSIS